MKLVQMRATGRSLRRSFIVFLLLGLLCLMRGGALVASIGDYRLARARKVLYSLPPAISEIEGMERLSEREEQCIQEIIGAGFESALLLTIGFIVFRVRKRIDGVGSS